MTEAAIPTLREELTRKALEAAEMVIFDRENAKITAPQYAYAVDVLWKALAGIVDEEFTLLMEKMGEEAKKAGRVTKVYLQDVKGTTIRLVNTHNGLLVMDTWGAGKEVVTKRFDLRDAACPAKEANEKLKALVYFLNTKGFKPI